MRSAMLRAATPLELLALPPLETYTSKLGSDRKGMGLLMVLLMELGVKVLLFEN